MPEHRYRLRYSLKPEVGDFGRQDRGDKGNGVGLTDALLVFSLLFPEDGSFSLAFTGHDGRNQGEELPDIDIFKIWTLLSSRLARSTDGSMSKAQREFCAAVFTTWCEAMNRGDQGNPIDTLQ